MNRFKITKIGLLNFWLYDEEEYDFYGGKLILRGTNGSGKSVTMQSFIPLILDGNKSPERLDPFGSKERKIEDYILGDSSSLQKEEATSYLYMETYNEEEKKYITIGLGFRGRKGKGVDSWGFVLKDGARVGKDFFLYKSPVNKIPLSKNELKARLGTINEFTDTMKEYKAMVNRLLFGFSSLDTYDEFIKLLLQLRSNKLSKDYKPTNLIQVLNTVLQPLTEEDLRPLSEAIEQMNKTKEQVETLERNIKKLKDFLKVYRNYNEILLVTKARNYQAKNTTYQTIKENIDELSKKLEKFKMEIEEKKKRYNEVLNELDIHREQKEQLEDSDLKQKITALGKIKEDIITLTAKVEELDITIDKRKEEEIEYKKKIKQVEDVIYDLKRQMDEECIDLKDLSQDSYFDEIVFFCDELKENIDQSMSFESIFMSLKTYENKVSMLISLLEEEQKIVMESERTRVEFEKLVNAYQIVEKDLTNEEKNLKESILAWEEEFINKINNNKYLKMDDELQKKIFVLMNNYSKNNYNEVVSIYTEAALQIKESMIETRLGLANKREQKRMELAQLTSSYATLKEKEDIELPTLNEQADQLLKENNIPFLPFYKCIEFKEHIADQVKDNIESALLELGILNAKVVREEDMERIEKLNEQVIYLKKTTKKIKNLSQYFDVKLDKDSPIKESTVQAILESISVDQNDIVAILENGLAKMDVLHAIADRNYEQVYIGYLKRKELKMQKLHEIELQIENVKANLNMIENAIQECNEKLEVLEKEKGNIPTDTFITEIMDKIKNMTMELTYNDKKQKELEENILENDKEIKKIREKIEEKKRGIYIPLHLNACKEVSEVLKGMREILDRLRNAHGTYLNKQEVKNSMQESLEGTQSSLDYLISDKIEKENELKKNIAMQDSIHALLETEEYKDQKERLLSIETNIRNLEKEKEQLIKEISNLEKDIEYEGASLEEDHTKEENMKKEVDTYLEVFLREYKLNYVYTDEIVHTDKTIKMVLKDGALRKEVSLNEALTNFYSSYNRYSLELNDYSLRDVTLFNDYDMSSEREKEIYENNTRVDVVAMYQGVKVNLLSLANKLESDIEENKDLISRQDRHLFEDILLNTVGEKIKKRIDDSSKWVDKINKIMSSMQENSALSFKLVWKSIAADSEGEMDTKEIVRILKMEPELMKESDREKLTNHFRSKIKKAEELYQDSYISFYMFIEDVLDYRNWFTFQLLYQQKNENMKELTDKAFSKFSGGERAKSMYIPLFASVYAKLNQARQNALRIIALDEAFAGVDEDNIREMFGILKYLDIDFIINSQILWGDYDTIEDLSICELIRPQNSSVVTVERYRWNGKYKEIIHDREKDSGVLVDA